MTEDVKTQRHGRLQRARSIDGVHVNSFVQVLYRHGLVMGIVSMILLLLSAAENPMQHYTIGLFSNPQPYLLATIAIVIFCVFYSHFRRMGYFPMQGFWLSYLLYISIVEELTFRVLLPNILSISLQSTAAVVLSNIIFAGFHYYTLRWKLINCLAVFFAGLGLSRLLNNTEDLALVVLVHWLVTFINTPTWPGGR